MITSLVKSNDALNLNSLGLFMTVLSKKGSNSGAKDGNDDGDDSESSSLVLHREAQALMKRVEDFPSRTAW